jgi:lysophospholipase L1-like esterase
MRPDSRLLFAACYFAVVLLPISGLAGPLQSYLALGDSIAFGETNVLPVSFGDQGYVKLYADFLAGQDAGLRPNVINLAIPGETSTSFFTGVSPAGFAPHNVLDGFNLNYAANPAQSQNSLMLSTFAAEAAAGHVISHVSFALGVNDLLPFELLHPDFFTLSASQQTALVNEFFAILTANYVAALSEIRAALPNAELLLLNYYNPDTIFGPTDTFNIINGLFDNGQTALIDSLAGPFDAKVVDIHSAFVGHETELTFILSGGVHPNDAGYAVIADQMIAATVPEPGSFALVAFAVVSIFVCRILANLHPGGDSGHPRHVRSAQRCRPRPRGVGLFARRLPGVVGPARSTAALCRGRCDSPPLRP